MLVELEHAAASPSGALAYILAAFYSVFVERTFLTSKLGKDAVTVSICRLLFDPVYADLMHAAPGSQCNAGLESFLEVRPPGRERSHA